MSQSHNNARESLFLSEQQWAQQEAINHLGQSVQEQLAPLTQSEQLRYRQLVRQYALALEDVERADLTLKKDFEAFGSQAIRAHLAAATGVDLDPHTTYIHTRYLHAPERPRPFPQRLRRSPGSTDETHVLPEPHALLDEYAPVAHVLSMSLWQAACLNFGFLSYFASFNSDSFVNSSFISHSPGVDFRLAQAPESINSNSIIPVKTFVTLARRLNLGSELKRRVDHAMSKDGQLSNLLRTCTQAHVQFCLMELYRSQGLYVGAREDVKKLSDAIDSASSRLRVRQVVMTVGYTIVQFWSGKGLRITPGFITASAPAPEDETDGHHISIPLFQIELHDTQRVFSFFPGRPNGELRLHLNPKALIADFRAQLLTAHAENKMDWFKSHLKAEYYERLTADLSLSTHADSFNITGVPPRIQRHWIPFFNLGFKPLSPKTSLEEALLVFQSDLYAARLRQLAVERSVQDWADIVSTISTLFDELASFFLIPVPGAVKGLSKVIRLLFTGATVKGLFSALEQSSQGDSRGLIQTWVDAADLLISSVLMAKAGRLAQGRHAALLQRLGQPRIYTRGDGSTGVWESDPARFTLPPATVTDNMKLDEQGIYRQAGRDYVLLEKDGHTFVVEVERNLNGTWRAIVNNDSASFRPQVTLNATHQRWQLALDDSHRLTDGQLLSRMVSGMTAEAAHVALKISAISRTDLQRMWQGGRAPASLTDAVTRFHADTQLQRCADELSRYPQARSLTERPVLALITQLPYWPQGTHLYVLGADGTLSEAFGQVSLKAPKSNEVVLRRLDDGEFYLSRSSLFKAFDSDVLGELVNQLKLPTDRVQLSQWLASQLNTHKDALFTALTLHIDRPPEGHSLSSLDLTWIPSEKPRKLSVLSIITPLRALYPGLSQARSEELMRLNPALGGYVSHFEAALGRGSSSTDFLPEPLSRALMNAVFSARLERMLDGVYNPRAFNPDVDHWSKELCTRVIKHRYDIELVITATSTPDTLAAEYRYSDSKRVIHDLGDGVYAAYSRQQHALMPPVSGPNSFYVALISGLSDSSQTTRLLSPDLLTVEGWRQRVADDLIKFRTPHGFIHTDNPQVASYSLPDEAWSIDKQPSTSGIYTVDDLHAIVLDGKFYAVQSPTDGLTNSIIDRKRFAHAPVPLIGNGEGAWRHAFERPMEWEGQYLFRRLGFRAAGFNSDQVSAILSVSNTSDEMLRRVHVNRERMSPLLSDTLQRFAHVNGLEAVADLPDPSVELIKRVFPSLTTPIATDLIHSADVYELRQIKAGRIPLRLSQEARWYVREVRVNRAIEGFYVPAMQNHDHLKLVLHGLTQLPGWSADLKIEVREGSTSGALISALGPSKGRVELTVVKTAHEWQVFSATEQTAKASAQDVFVALISALPDRERQALGHTFAQGVEVLKEQVTLTIIENRDRLYDVLGMIAQRPWFTPPKRLADGRIGYSLSGRGSATERFFADSESRHRYERIYPASASGESVRALQRLRARGLDVDQALTRLEREARLLQQQLGTWLAEKPDFNPLDLTAQHHKHDLADKLLKAWRKETPPVIDQAGNTVGYALELEGWRVPTLPNLTADFSHIRRLSMARLRVGTLMDFGVDANINQFLLNFRSLTSLSIENCRLGRFPEAIGQMTPLLKLSLAFNAITLDQVDQQRLTGLVHLQRLNLHGCVLIGRFDVRTLTQLRELNISNTEAVTWPQGVMQLPHINRLDLSRNHILTVPAEVLSGSETINRGTSLQENDLTPATMRQLQDYQARTGIHFGLHHDANHPPRLEFDDEVWLNGFDADERQIRYEACQLLREDPRALSFFKLIDDLKTTADYELIKDDLVVRVQSVLHEATQNEQVRTALFSLCSTPRRCCDATALVFSQLEVQVLVSKALAEGDPSRAERSLARIIRGEFRLKVLDSFAYEECRTRIQPVDELEIGFTYRLKLREVLELPAQPKHMKFTSLGFVEPAVIEQAGVRILAMDSGEAMLDFMVNDPLWDRFLRGQYADQFDAVYNASHSVEHGKDIYDAERYARELLALQNRLTLDALAKLNSP